MIKVNLNNYFEKLRALPDKQKKIILWTIVAVLGIVLLFFWFNSAAKRISKLGEGFKNIELPQVEIQIPAAEMEQKDETAGPALSEVEGWKTYANNAYGFEIKYPNDWFTGGFSADYSDTIQISPISPDDSIAFTGEALSLNISKIKAGSSLLVEAEKRFGKINDGFTIEKSLKIGGVDSFKIKENCDGVGCGAPEWIFIKNNYFYFLSSGLNSTKQGPIFEKIISTFKFIK